MEIQQFTWKEACTPESIANLGLDVKSKSMHKGDVPKVCVGSLVFWCKPSCEVNMSIFAPSKLVLPLIHQLCDFALKSSNTNTKNGLKSVVTLSKFSPTLFISELNSSWDWLGDR